eukprot:TRINITY_DN5247_c0_g2_i1.p1 TRINITY_DN5247_c0_g2~~TRINITY_DN5247_c0_g2_i1.p1  ORF type:complete len:152 (-),score=21.17 TRINITY_DN5247_c0_g2_i1:39-494(-)
MRTHLLVCFVLLCCSFYMSFISCEQEATLIGELNPIPSDFYNCTMTSECMLIEPQCDQEDCPRFNPAMERIDGSAVNRQYFDFRWGGLCNMISIHPRTCDRAEAQCINGQCTRVVTATFPNGATAATHHRNAYMMVLIMMTGVMMMMMIAI